MSNYYNPFNMQYQMPTYQPQQVQNNTDERIWVQNETSAEAYLLAPNAFVRLWDSNRPVFYEKRSDSSGRPFPMDIFEYKRLTPHADAIPSVDYQKEIDALKSRIKALEEVNYAKQSDANDSAIQSV